MMYINILYILLSKFNQYSLIKNQEDVFIFNQYYIENQNWVKV